MNNIYIVELVHSSTNYTELLGRFETIYFAYDYIEQYSTVYGYKLIMNYSDLSEDQSRGSIISVNNIKTATKYIQIHSEKKLKKSNK
jgi:hypothetical protein